jgi:hypothetical protein
MNSNLVRRSLDIEFLASAGVRQPSTDVAPTVSREVAATASDAMAPTMVRTADPPRSTLPWRYKFCGASRFREFSSKHRPERVQI